MSPIISKHSHNGINLIIQGRGFLNRIYLLTLWSSLGVPSIILLKQLTTNGRDLPRKSYNKSTVLINQYHGYLIYGSKQHGSLIFQRSKHVPHTMISFREAYGLKNVV
jgi:hypothetical protein